MDEILQHLKKNGEQLDTEIAVATGISLATVRRHLADLTAKYEVVTPPLPPLPPFSLF